jgi:hypothetical protein
MSTFVYSKTKPSSPSVVPEVRYTWSFLWIDTYGLHEPPSPGGYPSLQEHFATPLFAREYLADTTTSTTHTRSYRIPHTHSQHRATSRTRQHQRAIARWTCTATALPRPPRKEAEKTRKLRSHGAATPPSHRRRTLPPIRGDSTPRRLVKKRK